MKHQWWRSADDFGDFGWGDFVLAQLEGAERNVAMLDYPRGNGFIGEWSFAGEQERCS